MDVRRFACVAAFAAAFPVGCAGPARTAPAPVYERVATVPMPKPTAASLSPDGRWLLVGCADNSVRLYSADDLSLRARGHAIHLVDDLWSHKKWMDLNGRFRWRLPIRTGAVEEVGFSPSGELVTAGSLWGQVVCAVRADELVPVRVIDKDLDSYRPTTCGFGPDGSLAGATAGTLAVWGPDGTMTRSSLPDIDPLFVLPSRSGRTVFICGQTAGGYLAGFRFPGDGPEPAGVAEIRL